MGFRNRKDSFESQTKRWIARHRGKLIGLGVKTSILDDTADFYHDFLLHGWGLRQGLTREQKIELLAFLSKQWEEDIMRPGSWNELAHSLGPNVRLQLISGELDWRGLIWLETDLGRTMAVAVESRKDFVDCYVFCLDLFWVGCSFRAVMGEFEVASGIVDGFC